MLTLDGVDLIYQTVSRYHKNFCLMHCVSSYPVPAEEVNLNVIKLYQQRYADINIGYSGHELGIGISLGAVAMGAKVCHINFNINSVIIL